MKLLRDNIQEIINRTLDSQVTAKMDIIVVIIMSVIAGEWFGQAEKQAQHVLSWEKQWVKKDELL